jgi:hypothetical protein
MNNHQKHYQAYKTWIETGITNPSEFVVATLDCQPNISLIKLHKSTSYLLNLIDRVAYGRRSPHRLKRIVVFEGGASHRQPSSQKPRFLLNQTGTKPVQVTLLPPGTARQQTDPNPHCHMIIQIGGKIHTTADLIQLIENTWKSFQGAGKYGRIEPYRPAGGWCGYLADMLAMGSDPNSEDVAMRLSNW